MTLKELLKSMGKSVQEAESEMALAGESLFLRDYEEGNPVIRGFNFPNETQNIPSTTLKHHLPLGYKKVVIETETDVRLDQLNGNGEEPSEVKISLKRNLFRKSARMRIHVEFEMRPTPEGISRIHESLLDSIDKVPMTELTPAKKGK